MGSTRHRVTRATMVGAIATGILVAAGPVAQAAPVLKDPPCNRGEVCLYRSNQLLTKIPPVRPGECKSVNRSYDYIRNLSDVSQRAWSGNYCEGASTLVIPGQSTYVNFKWSVGGWP
ncbi:hypothetical protein E1281_34235 [Actinomadura sp. KC345]|uniref:hypothetical protein n=1 Tax=Actinomadura sp. KC345 TaxID=2530371 RepID=UPI0010519295|nr:hypothetical protein [Actinomadura sp. KC345]TDC44365.1 hypothetical protein E1281_34235 [Actinomadura sp. KC345]